VLKFKRKFRRLKVNKYQRSEDCAAYFYRYSVLLYKSYIFICNHDLRDKHNLICFIGLQCVCQFRLLMFVQPDFNLHILCSTEWNDSLKINLKGFRRKQQQTLRSWGKIRVTEISVMTSFFWSEFRTEHFRKRKCLTTKI
jgi:hypothetical protein